MKKKKKKSKFTVFIPLTYHSVSQKRNKITYFNSSINFSYVQVFESDVLYLIAPSKISSFCNTIYHNTWCGAQFVRKLAVESIPLSFCFFYFSCFFFTRNFEQSLHELDIVLSDNIFIVYCLFLFRSHIQENTIFYF